MTEFARPVPITEASAAIVKPLGIETCRDAEAMVKDGNGHTCSFSAPA